VIFLSIYHIILRYTYLKEFGTWLGVGEETVMEGKRRGNVRKEFRERGVNWQME
jgi:hypothetical protein